MYNKVILVGRTTKEVELRRFGEDSRVATFTLAVNEKYVKAGEDPKTNFISCVAWNNTADFMEKYVPKGTLVLVDGRIQTRNYDDKDGKKVYVTEIRVENLQKLEKKGEDTPQENKEEAIALTPDELIKAVSDDDLPF